MATAALVLNHQTISIHSAEKIWSYRTGFIQQCFIYSEQRQVRKFHFSQKWPSCLRVNYQWRIHEALNLSSLFSQTGPEPSQESVLASCHVDPNNEFQWGRIKMAAISQTTFPNAFSWMKMLEYWLEFYWSLFLRVQLTINKHSFR